MALAPSSPILLSSRLRAREVKKKKKRDKVSHQNEGEGKERGRRPYALEIFQSLVALERLGDGARILVTEVIAAEAVCAFAAERERERERERCNPQGYNACQTRYHPLVLG